MQGKIKIERPNNIERLRLAKGWTMQDLADKMDTQRGQINKLEKGHTQLKEFWLKKLAHAFECSVEDILLSSGEKPDNSSFQTISSKLEAIVAEIKHTETRSNHEDEMLVLYRRLEKSQKQAVLALINILLSENPQKKS